MKTFALLFVPVSFVVVFISIATAVSTFVADSKKVELPKYSTTVELDIQAESDIMKNEVYSYISRELRTLGDVEVVEDEDNAAEWIIQVIALPTKYTDGQTTGQVVVSSLVLQPLWADRLFIAALWPKIKETCDEEEIQLFTRHMQSSCHVGSHMVQSGNSEELQGLCKSIVTDFDAEHLKNAREFHQKLTKINLSIKTKLKLLPKLELLLEKVRAAPSNKPE